MRKFYARAWIDGKCIQGEKLYDHCKEAAIGAALQGANSVVVYAHHPDAETAGALWPEHDAQWCTYDAEDCAKMREAVC